MKPTIHSSKKILLTNHQSPGDVIMLTSAVRDLKKSHPDFLIDPQIRLQKFGGNIGEDIVDINSNLLGVNKRLIKYDFTLNSRDPYIKTTYVKNNYPTINFAITDQSRSVMPSWQLKDLERMNLINFFSSSFCPFCILFATWV